MSFELENEKIRITVDAKGGELKSLYEKVSGQEYIWQGDEQYWEDSSPNLFPYIARLTKNTYLYQGKQYHMSIHGFVKDMVLTGEKLLNELVFELKSNEDTLKCYPFQFIYRIRYTLEETALIITYEVENLDQERMYFGIGGHPGFNVPFIKNTAFEDYYIEFDSDESPVRIKMSPDCFVVGEEAFDKINHRKLELSHQLFNDDAIILREMGKKVVLKTAKSHQNITMAFPDMDYLGIWHAPCTKAPYICIEPWSSLPSRKDIIEDLAKQEDLIGLNAGEVYQNRWSISVCPN